MLLAKENNVADHQHCVDSLRTDLQIVNSIELGGRLRSLNERPRISR